jgi:cytochrome b subunit of formate dehydrogenase
LNPIQWAHNPWGQDVPIHIAWYLLYVCAAAGVLFLIGHLIWINFFATPDVYSEESEASPAVAARVPERVARHSFGARAFHGIMALSMFALLFTAFLPKVGVQFPWVTYHWIAGVVLTISIIYHIIHATFVMDFWSIWPDRIDIEDASRRLKSAMGEPAPPPRKFAKYPLENKLYHLGVLSAGLSVVLTGVFMMKRVQTPFYTRNPYLFSDMTWGWMYVLHGLAGVGFVTLVTIHVYFALRPEKLAITKSMLFGWISREQYLEHHDPRRWPAVAQEETEARHTGQVESKKAPA